MGIVDMFAIDIVGFEERFAMLWRIVSDVEILHGLCKNEKEKKMKKTSDSVVFCPFGVTYCRMIYSTRKDERFRT